MDSEEALKEFYIIVSEDEKIKLLKIAFGDNYIKFI